MRRPVGLVLVPVAPVLDPVRVLVPAVPVRRRVPHVPVALVTPLVPALLPPVPVLVDQVAVPRPVAAVDLVAHSARRRVVAVAT